MIKEKKTFKINQNILVPQSKQNHFVQMELKNEMEQLRSYNDELLQEMKLGEEENIRSNLKETISILFPNGTDFLVSDENRKKVTQWKKRSKGGDEFLPVPLI